MTRIATARLEIIAVRGGAPRARSGAKATRSRTIPKSPVARKATTAAAGAGSPKPSKRKKPPNPPHQETTPGGRGRESGEGETRGKPPRNRPAEPAGKVRVL